MAQYSNRQKSWIGTFLYPMCVKKCSPLLQIRSCVDKTLGTQVWGSEFESPSSQKARCRLASHSALLLWGQGERRSVPQTTSWYTAQQEASRDVLPLQGEGRQDQHLTLPLTSTRMPGHASVGTQTQHTYFKINKKEKQRQPRNGKL